MRVNTNLSTKEKRRYALDNLGGVDFSSSPLTCSPLRSPNAVNWIGDHGINRKRHGWEQVMDRFTEMEGFGVGIGGIIPIKNDKPRTDEILIIANGIVYLMTLEDGNWSAKKKNKKVSGRVSAFFSAGKCYIVGSKEYLCYDIEEKTLTEIDPYIPTTTIDIGHKWLKTNKQSTLEPVNLLTRWRRNTLLGVEELPKTDSEGNKWVGYYLDGEVMEDTKVEIIALVKGEEGEDAVNTLTIRSGEGDQKNQLYYTDENGENVNCGTIKRKSNANGRAVLQFTEAFPTPVEDTPNITVTFCAAGVDKSALINYCTFGTLFGVGGAQDRLFLSGNPDYPNVVFFSEKDNFTYFPDTYTATCGTDDDPIRGMLRLSDNVLAILKTKSVYYQSGEYLNTYDDAGNIKRSYPVFRITAGSISEGALNPFAVANFGNDNVFVSRNGVFAIEPTSNVLTNTRTARERSRPIASRLQKNANAAVSCITHGQRLYVADGNGGCYVADSAYNTPTGSETYSYEWWYWDNIPARVWAIVNDELWFGTLDGRVCRFTDGYCDSYYDVLSAGDVSIDYENDRFVINRNVLSEEDIGKRFQVATKGIYATYAPIDHTDTINNRMYIKGNWIYTFSENDTVSVYNSVTGEIEEFTVIEVNITERWLKLKDGKGIEVGYLGNSSKFVLLNMNQHMRISNVFIEGIEGIEGEKHYMTVSSAIANDLNYGFINVLGNDVILRIYVDSPVVAEWQSPPLDFGIDSYTKCLYSITVTAETGQGSVLEFGYDTRKKGERFDAHGLGVFSFEDMDFTAFSFENGFQSSYTVRARDRDFNFFRFCLRSDGDKPCAVHRISALYKINKKTKGVM